MATAADKTILIVDDEPDIRNYFQRLLEDAGFHVVTASNGQEALDRVREQTPDFISLDLVMPQKSGIRFFHELRRNREWSKIPVVIVTAHASDEFGKRDIDEIMQNTTVSGPELYLEKPIKPHHYVNTVRKLLGLPVEAEVPEKEDTLRSELEDLVKSADVTKLQQALEALKKK